MEAVEAPATTTQEPALPMLVVRSTNNRTAPRYLQWFLEKAGGRNPYGEPKFRLMWGGNRLVWRHGLWEDKDESGNVTRSVVEARSVHKYGYAMERWHLEMWHPPEYYGTPEEWAEATRNEERGYYCDTLGEFPRRGAYESVFCFETSSCSCNPKNPASHCEKCGGGTTYCEPTRELLERYLWLRKQEEGKLLAKIRDELATARAVEKAKSIDYYYKDATEHSKTFPSGYVSYAGLLIPGDTKKEEIP
jgi:hypothetical protein